MSINIIACVNTVRAIGKNNNLLYRIPEDLWLFKQLTKNNIVIMGTNTWKSIGEKELPNRHNVVVRRGHLSSVIKTSLHIKKPDQEIFIIGGGKIYEEVLNNHLNDYDINLFLTHVMDNTEGDVYFPPIDHSIWTEKYRSHTKKDEKTGLSYYMTHHYHPNGMTSPLYNLLSDVTPTVSSHEEYQYLNLLRDCLMNGQRRGTRNYITRSIFGVRMEYKDLPLITTKKLAWKTCIKELLWFISGDTSVRTLQAQDVHIWDANYNKDLDLCDTGDLGKIYGYQWRKCGGYIDQLQECIDLIKHEPSSRRIIMSSWIPQDLHDMALPPCHILCQWYVNTKDQTLSLQLYQRSGDAFLGVPFNMFSYGVLLRMVASITDKKVGSLIHIIGDFHIYENHLDAIKEQLSRNPLSIQNTKLTISKKYNINDYKIDDFILEDYNHHPPIKAEMIA